MIRIAVHIELEHTCGHMHKTIYHMNDANINVKLTPYIGPFKPLTDIDLSKSFKELIQPVEDKSTHTLDFSGSFDKVEITTCTCHLSRRARVRRWIMRMLRYRHKEQE